MMEMSTYGRKSTRNYKLLTLFIRIVGEVKNKMYEYFRAFEKENSTCSTFLNDIALSGYIRKVLKVTQKFFLKSTIINTSNSGKLQVIINTEI